jgi:hypothetical protein
MLQIFENTDLCALPDFDILHEYIFVVTIESLELLVLVAL